MEGEPNASFIDKTVPCYCWKCFVQAEFLQDFGSIQEYRCPKCFIQIRIGDAESFDPLRTAEDDSDSVSVCVSPSTTSRRSTITYSESEAGTSDDIDNRPRTPENFDVVVGQTPPPPPPTNTPAEGDIPDAAPNIAKAFADVTNYLLNVPTPRRMYQRYSFGGLSGISGSDSISPSKMITNVVQAYEKCSLGGNNSISETETNVGDFAEQSIKIRISPSPDTKDATSKIFSRKVSASELSDNGEDSKNLGYKKD